jgi:hypothetical protein
MLAPASRDSEMTRPRIRSRLQSMSDSEWRVLSG